MKYVSSDTLHQAFAMALHNLLVRNNINSHDFLNTMNEFRIKELYIQNPRPVGDETDKYKEIL